MSGRPWHDAIRGAANPPHAYAHRACTTGKRALLAFVARVLTELAALKAPVEEPMAEQVASNARVAELLPEDAALKARLERRERDAKRSAAPFSRGPRKAQPRRPGRKPGSAIRGSTARAGG